MVLERNFERILSERSNLGHNSDLERLLHARDRSREPLHLADLSLDDWQPRTISDNNQNTEKTDDKDNNNGSTEETPPHASSMPELAVAAGSSDSTAGESTTTPGSPYKRNRGLLSVRFQGDNDAFEGDEGDSGSMEATKKFPRSRSYSGRTRHIDSLERRRPRKTTSEGQVAGSSRHHDEDASSYCSTCSSSSSSDDLDYQLPPRRAYGGVRISYVPNDALACARRRQAAAGPKSPTKKGNIDDKDKNCIIS